MSQGLEQVDLSVHCQYIIEELYARRDGGGGRSVGISGWCCKDHCIEGGVDSVDLLLFAFLGAAIFCKVV